MTESGCLCRSCGVRYRGDLMVPDEVWEKIKPEGKAEGAGLLCANCIVGRIREQGIWSAAQAFDVDDAPPRAVQTHQHLRRAVRRMERIWPPRAANAVLAKENGLYGWLRLYMKVIDLAKGKMR